jgi:hypothetical protein
LSEAMTRLGTKAVQTTWFSYGFSYFDANCGVLPMGRVVRPILRRWAWKPRSNLERPIPLGLLAPPNEAETLYARANARIHTHVRMDGQLGQSRTR